MSEIIEYIRENEHKNGSIPFWSWNDKLDSNRLKKQIDDMKNADMRGFFMHARSGLETEYLSDEWFDCIKESVKHAKELGMEAWSYDENGWPSGFAGGKLLKDEKYLVKYLTYEKKSTFDDKALACYVLENNSVKRVFENDSSYTEYHCIYRGIDEAYVDTLNKEVALKFIEYTHEVYKKELGDDFGTAMPGFFTDEPQYYRWQTPWSDIMPDAFKKRFGYDIMDYLPCLFIDFDLAYQYRYDYHLICHEMFVNNFMKTIYDWASENGIKITGHSIEEKFLGGQMWCCGGVMPTYEYYHIPGVDYLGKGPGNDISHKQIGSVAAQLGKKEVLSEMYACCSWEVTPNELKQVAEHQYFGGVNTMCQHLYPYSERGQRKRDYPAHYSEHLPWHEKLKDFNTYFNRLGTILKSGDDECNVLVIHPMHGCYLNYNRIDDGKTIGELEDNFSSLTNLLSQNQIQYHYGDEILMAKYASVNANIISVGKCDYEYVIVPLIYTLDKSTYKLLSEYQNNGGKLLFYSDIPTMIDGRLADLSNLSSNISMDDIINSCAVSVDADEEIKKCIRISVKDTTFGKLYYILNLSKKPLSSVCFTIKDTSSVSLVDLQKMKHFTIDSENVNENSVFSLDFEPVQSYIVFDTTGDLRDDGNNEIAKIKEYKIANISQNALTLDRFRLSYDGENWTEQRPIERVRDNLLKERYKGKLYLAYDFESKAELENLEFVLEPLNYEYVRLNGEDIKLSNKKHIDESFLVYDIERIKTGNNTIEVKFDYYQDDYVYHVLFDNVTESLRNCLCFDTEIEAGYVFGDFSVICDGTFNEEYHEYSIFDGKFVLDNQNTDIELNNLVKEGYPFFCGTVDIECILQNGGNIISLPGSYTMAELFVNDESKGLFMFSDRIVLDESIDKDKDNVKIRIWGTNRNLLGPHHWPDCEAYVSPETFSFEKKWDNDECPAFRYTYSFKRVGINK